VQREGLTVAPDVGDKISHYCALDEEAEVVDRWKLKTTPSLPITFIRAARWGL
jgi:hypothetical protein